MKNHRIAAALFAASVATAPAIGALSVFAADNGWHQDGDSWTFTKKDGEPAVGWLEIGPDTYHFDANGIMDAGKWISGEDGYSYVDKEGHMKKSAWLKTGGNWYYFKKDGKMAASEVINGYPVNGEGVWVEEDALAGTYRYSITGYDWGCGVDKAVIQLAQSVSNVNADTFKVTETKEATDYSDPEYPVNIVEVARKVEKAYTSDAQGNPVSTPSEYVTLELYVSPNDGSPVNYSMVTKYNTWSHPYELNVNLANGQSVTGADGKSYNFVDVQKVSTGRSTNADAMTTSTYKASDGITLNYGQWKPEQASKTLFVWVHGQGEGGYETVGSVTDPYITALANKVTAFFGDEFQNTVGGANVLVPQCPTYWRNPDIAPSATESHYNKALTELIDAKKAELGCDKVVIAGCSSGGFMTMSLALYNGTKYDAYVPICEAMKDKEISDDQIKDFAKLNMYFIWTDDDTTVVPEEGPLPTSTRIREAGGNVTAWHTDHVIDTSGKYTDAEGNPHQYSGHWSWIYFDNNEAHDKGQITVWDWIAKQIK